MPFSLGILFFLISYKLKNYYQSWLNPGSIFSGLWGVIFILYSLRLFGMYSASSYTLMVFSVGILSFACGCIPASFSFGGKRLNKDYSPSRKPFAFREGTRYIFLLLSIFANAILVVRAIKVLPYWVYGVSVVKQANAEGYIDYSSWISILYTFFANPFETLSVFVMTVDFFYEKAAYSKIQLFLTVCMLLFGYIASGSKFSLLVPVISVIIVYFLNIRDKKVTAKKLHLSIVKKIFVGIAVFAVCAFLIYMLKKKSGSWTESLYMYLTGCIPCGDYALSSMVENGKHFYGMVSLNGVFRVMSQVLSLIGIKAPLQRCTKGT